MTDDEIMAKISDHGGTVAYSSMSGWLGGVRGIRIERVRALAKAGKLIAMSSTLIKKTRRSRALPIHITSYSLP
jgi:hypothetical protein